MGRAFEFRKERKFKRWGHMAKTFTKIGKEITIAVKQGGADVTGNPRLRALLQEARSDRPYPVGTLGDITIYFMHYKSFEEAKAKWEERTTRINFDNLFFIMSEREGCTPTVAERFDRLPYRNKVLLTHLPMPQVGCAHFLAGFENASELGTVTDMKPGPWLRRYIDDFDYVKFLNAGFAD